MDEDEAYPTSKIKLYPCDICERNFKQETLAKHRQICKKTSKKERKIFDSGKQRAEGSDVIYAKTKETKKVQILGEKPEQTGPVSNWREKHTEFVKNVRNARIISEAVRTGAPVPKFEASAVPSDYVNCQYCNRNFSKNAAERHIPFCETQSKRQKINNSANQKLKPKTQAPSSSSGGVQRKQSSEPYDQPGSNANYNGVNRGIAGYQSGNSNKGINSGNERKPIKYDNNPYSYEDQDYGGSSGGGGGSYAMKNKALLAANKSKQEMLRTGRNTTNSELNALARNRGGTSQKESPINSRDTSTRRVPQQQQQAPTQAQNGARGTNSYARGNGGSGSGGGGGGGSQQQNGEGVGGSSKFCHECGSEFPVQWARFCSFCGDRRL